MLSSFQRGYEGQRPLIVLFVMPEILNQEYMFLNTSGPRLKDCRGDEEVGIQVFLPLNNLDS